MDTDIRRRLFAAEGDFLAALLSGPVAIEAFDSQWHALLQDWKKHNDTLDEDTVDLANTTSTRIGLLAEDFFDSQLKASSLEDELDQGVAAIFDSHMDGRASSSSFRGSDRVLPAVWLLQNLHNPYPSQALKESMDFSVDFTAKSVGGWFTKARQRIGWTRLMRDRFNGSRTAAIQAAFRAYTRDDPTNPLERELITAFLAIKSHAELVFAQNTLPGDDRCFGRSRSISPTPSLTFSSNTDDSDEDVPSLFGPRAGQKHHLEEGCLLDDRLLKRPRSRLSDLPSSHVFPCSDAIHFHIPQTHPMNESSISVGYTPSIRRSRKRRLSDAEIDQHRPKRPHRQSDQRPYAVSDPLPSSSLDKDLDDWFETTFQMPSPANIDSIDTNLPDSEFLRAIDLVNTAEITNEIPMFLYEGYPSNPYFNHSSDSNHIDVVDDDEPSSTSLPPSMSTSGSISGDCLDFDFEFWNPSMREDEDVSADFALAISNPLFPPEFTSDPCCNSIPLLSVPTQPLMDTVDASQTFDATLDHNPAISPLSDSDESELVGKWLATSLL